MSGGVVNVDNSSACSIRNTIVARNTATGRDPDVTGSFDSLGHNLIGVLTANATGFVASDLRGTAAVPLDPRLNPLRNNGGRTMTHSLRHDSPAVNAGDNAGAPPTDQRGHWRIVGGTIDIGSYEAAFRRGRASVEEMSADLVSRPHDEFGATAVVGQPRSRLPDIGRLTSFGEPFGSKRETPNWLGVVVVGKGATPPNLLDVSFVSRDLDLDNAVFVGRPKKATA